MTDQRQAAIEKLVKDENVKHIQLWFTDILGNLKMVEIPDRQLPNVIESGAAFDGSSISGYAEIEESDIVAMPDWDTFTVLPWAQGSERTAFVFCDVLNRDYKPFEGDPRWVLRRQLERAKKMGLDFYVGPELEYFYFTNPEKPELTDEGGYFDVLPADLGNDLRKQTIRTLDKLGIPMEASHHEVAPSQHEIDPHYDEALRHGRPGHDHPPDRQRGRGPQRRPRDLHAQADARAERQRHARAPEPLPRQVERHVQRHRSGPPQRRGQVLHRRAAQAHEARSARFSTST